MWLCTEQTKAGALIREVEYSYIYDIIMRLYIDHIKTGIKYRGENHHVKPAPED